MTPEQLKALEAPNAVKNISIQETESFLFPQLEALALTPSGPYGIATGVMARTGSGPDGSFTPGEMKDLGVPNDLPIYLQYQVGSAHNNTMYDAADGVRLLQGYRSDETTEPDPNFWYVDRVRALFRENFQAPAEAADAAMLNLEGVRELIEERLKAVVTGAK